MRFNDMISTRLQVVSFPFEQVMQNNSETVICCFRYILCFPYQ
jgi:hypothetical protein